jgi:hypothetical protein
MKIILLYGKWQAIREDNRFFVIDTRTGVQFNCNSKAHAIQKALDYNRKESSR